MSAVVTVDDLVVELMTAGGIIRAVDGVSFRIDPGETVTIIGESGSGKSTIAKAVLRLLPRDSGHAEGRVLLEGDDVLALPLARFRPLRGRRLGFVPQDPASALNPVRTIGSQAHEAAALTGERDAARRRAAILEVGARIAAGVHCTERRVAATTTQRLAQAIPLFGCNAPRAIDRARQLGWRSRWHEDGGEVALSPPSHDFRHRPRQHARGVALECGPHCVLFREREPYTMRVRNFIGVVARERCDFCRGNCKLCEAARIDRHE